MTKLASILILVFLFSCATQRVVFDKEALQPVNHGYKTSQNFFLWGVLQTKQSSPIYICDSVDNIYSLESRKSAADVILNVITGGIVQLHVYTPRESVIYCKNS